MALGILYNSNNIPRYELHIGPQPLVARFFGLRNHPPPSQLNKMRIMNYTIAMSVTSLQFMSCDTLKERRQ